ncbi:ferredoxin [Streptomyces sp. NBC_00140]|uniref:ferredoxin n=1 Tax=Streptomyces sp. NBC_00140 TaxID=2975664 RepID=UPI00225A5683|nr:ferredoxin [Streptomyces sp. NBC_00140]MCX5336403.1 ferredoxin [Streptomyces sp. NBC_00140]
MKITVDEPKCVASGQCVLIAPDVFDQRDEDGMVVLLTESPESDQHQAVFESALACPAAAIHMAQA